MVILIYMKNQLFLTFVLIGIIFISGCVGQTKVSTTEEKQGINACINLCKSELQNGKDLSNGPCLSNEIITNWVCDIAHSPRQSVDNQPENQCSAFREGTAKHFVEVDTSCNFIKAI
jgi:hypothetical protein